MYKYLCIYPQIRGSTSKRGLNCSQSPFVDQGAEQLVTVSEKRWKIIQDPLISSYKTVHIPCRSRCIKMLSYVGAVDMYPECLWNMTPENVHLGCWAWNCSWSFPVDFSMQAHMFFRNTWHHPYISTCFSGNRFTSLYSCGRNMEESLTSFEMTVYMAYAEEHVCQPHRKVVITCYVTNVSYWPMSALVKQILLYSTLERWTSEYLSMYIDAILKKKKKSCSCSTMAYLI